MKISEEIPTLALEKEDERISFDITTMCDIEKNKRVADEVPHRHDYYAIIWVKDGKGTHHIDFHPYHYDSGTLFFLSPGQVHNLSVKGKNEGYVLLFTDDFFCCEDSNRQLLFEHSLFNNPSEPPVLTVDKEAQASLELVIQSLLQEHQSNADHKNEILRSYLKIFMLQAARLRSEQDALMQFTVSPERERFIAFNKAIEKHFRQKHSVSDYAEILAVSPKHLNEITKNQKGITAGKHIKNRIVLEAKRALSNSSSSIKEIAWDLGFDDHSYFSRLFKKETAQSPNQFREDFRKKYQPS